MSGDTVITVVGNLTAENVMVKVTAFWELVDRSRGPDQCHPWTGYVDKDGYGAFFFDGRMLGAHELALTFTTGERRHPSLDTCHSRHCTTRLCCNALHLRFDTRLSNVADAVAMGRAHRFDSRISDATVALIRERRAAGANQDDLAGQYGVSESYVSALVNGKARLEAGGPVASGRTYQRKAV